jgi:uncharacterized protein (TIGR03083 family)
MQLTPRYGPDPVLTLDSPPSAIFDPLVRQRRRLAAIVSEFSDAQWAHASRCDGWSTRDVINHLDTVNGFWALTVSLGAAGNPTQFLSTFDPVASPAQLVEASSELSIAQVLEQFVASNDAFINALEALDDSGWSALAEAPIGHVTISAMAHHALWDAWVHERDIVVPSGIEPAVEADEVAACLAYVAALGPAFMLTGGATQTGTLAVAATDPSVSVTIEIGSSSVSVSAGHPSPADFELTGNAVDLLEALSLRQPLTQTVPAEAQWMLSGLSAVFDAGE